jgi:hypothetical protein
VHSEGISIGEDSGGRFDAETIADSRCAFISGCTSGVKMNSQLIDC